MLYYFTLAYPLVFFFSFYLIPTPVLTLFPILWVLSKICVFSVFVIIISYLAGYQAQQQQRKQAQRSIIARKKIILSNEGTSYSCLSHCYIMTTELFKQLLLMSTYFYHGIYVMILHIKAALTKFYICFCKLLHQNIIYPSREIYAIYFSQYMHPLFSPKITYLADTC